MQDYRRRTTGGALGGQEEATFSGDPDWVYHARLDEFRNEFTPISREGLTDEEYREALTGQYLAYREQRYQYVVQNEAMKAYNVSYSANKDANRKVQNNLTWRGYPGNEFVADSCYMNSSFIANKVNGADAGEFGREGRESCAISATSYTYQISEKMGYTGENNLIVPASRVINGGVGRSNNAFSANWIHYMESTPPEFTSASDGSVRPGGTRLADMSLNEAIQSGNIGIGDEFSIRMGDESEDKSTSGCHAMYLVDVERDANGRVISYTLGGNNPPTLEVVDPSASSKFGNRDVVSVVHTGDWVRHQDAQRIEGMSIEELETELSQERQEVETLIGEMRETEQNYISIGGYDAGSLGRSGGYKTYYEGLSSASEEYVRSINQPILGNEMADDVAGRMLNAKPVLDPSDMELAPINLGLTEDQQRVLRRAERMYGENFEDYSPEERQEVVDTMEEQRIDAERQVQVNEALIEKGAYGNTGDGVRINDAVDSREEAEVDNSAEQEAVATPVAVMPPVEMER